MFVIAQSTLVNAEVAADGTAEDTAYYRRVLHELIDLGADMARLVHRQASEQAEAGVLGVGPDAADLTHAFDRVARGIRRTVALAHKLSEPARPSAAAPRTAARRRIIREVEDAIQRSVDEDEAEGLEAELSERIDSPDLEDDIDGRPVADIIADICRDLGIAASPGSHPWKRRTPDDVAALCARAARVATGWDLARAGAPRVVRSPPREVVTRVRTGSDPPGCGMDRD